MISFISCFLFGGAVYVLLELAWRGRSHISMFFAGGLAAALLAGIFARFQIPLIAKCAIGSLIITAIEFTAGYILNIRMGLNVWDYSRRPGNILGQICPAFSLMWAVLTIPIAYLGEVIHAIF